MVYMDSFISGKTHPDRFVILALPQAQLPDLASVFPF